MQKEVAGSAKNAKRGKCEEVDDDDSEDLATKVVIIHLMMVL